MIDLKILEQLAELLNRTEATSIEVTKSWFGRTTIKMSKGAPVPSGPVTYQVAQEGRPAAGAVTAGAVTAGAVTNPVETEPPAPSNFIEIESPMVGTFYAQPEPGADPYAQVGARITIGQTLGIIEAMKIMNPLDAEVAGVVVEVCVKDSQSVEFGQVLFRVDPNG
jgi:acetyl-CoA carboxylase biotin carboxyl carrier protein